MPQFFPLDVSRHVVFQVGNSLQFIQIYRWLYTSNNYAVSDCIAAFFNPQYIQQFFTIQLYIQLYPQYIQLYPQCITSKLYLTFFHDRTDIDIASGAQPSMPSGHRCTVLGAWVERFGTMAVSDTIGDTAYIHFSRGRTMK